MQPKTRAVIALDALGLAALAALFVLWCVRTPAAINGLPLATWPSMSMSW